MVRRSIRSTRADLIEGFLFLKASRLASSVAALTDDDGLPPALLQ
jgi:hypothetical protein